MTLQIGNLNRQDTGYFYVATSTGIGAEDYFSASKAWGAVVNQAFTYQNPGYVKRGIIKHIIYKIVPTNVVTYTLRLWKGVTDGTDLSAVTQILFQTAAAKVGGTLYMEPNLTAGTPAAAGSTLDIPFTTTDYLYYSLEWSAPPGVTTGVIFVKMIAYRF